MVKWFLLLTRISLYFSPVSLFTYFFCSIHHQTIHPKPTIQSYSPMDVSHLVHSVDGLHQLCQIKPGHRLVKLILVSVQQCHEISSRQVLHHLQAQIQITFCTQGDYSTAHTQPQAQLICLQLSLYTICSRWIRIKCLRCSACEAQQHR